MITNRFLTLPPPFPPPPSQALNATPVLRPQDVAFKTEGKITRFEADEEKGEYWAVGEGTNFTKIDLKKGAKLRSIGGWEGDVLVAADPTSDTRVQLAKFRDPAPGEGWAGAKRLERSDSKRAKLLSGGA